jgi:uncharacterized protein (TIGR02118 family)
MIRFSVFYPAADGLTFDMDYYLKTHIPLLQKRMGAAMKDIRVERGLSGGAPGSQAPYVAVVHGTFDSVEAFETAFAPHAAEIEGDIPNYTRIRPVLQMSEVMV